MIFSCMDCEDRHPGCHAVCELFKADREKYIKIRKKEHNFKIINNYFAERVIKNQGINAKKRLKSPRFVYRKGDD